MKQNEDKLEVLFRNRLSDLEMPVRDGFWEQLEDEVTQTRRTGIRHRILWQRWAVAASVLLLLGGASAAFWMLLPEKSASTAPVYTNWMYAGGPIGTDRPQPVADVVPAVEKPGPVRKVAPVQGSPAPSEEADSVVVNWEMSFEYRVRQTRNVSDQRYRQVACSGDNPDCAASGQESSVGDVASREAERLKRKWNFKAAMGPVLADGSTGLAVKASAERKLNRWLGVEAGLEYCSLNRSGDRSNHLAVPVKLNFQLAGGEKWDLYASLGMAAGKCVGGKQADAGPLYGTAMAGVGAAYKLNDRLAVFAEPEVTCRVDRQVSNRAGFTMLCGIRMSY